MKVKRWKELDITKQKDYTKHMLLETTFYTLGIFTMGLFLILLLVIIAFLVKLKRDVEAFKAGFAGKVVTVLKERNMEVASALGLTFAHFFMDKMKKSVQEKRKNS